MQMIEYYATHTQNNIVYTFSGDLFFSDEFFAFDMLINIWQNTSHTS